jgi:hypothetical protein
MEARGPLRRIAEIVGHVGDEGARCFEAIELRRHLKERLLRRGGLKCADIGRGTCAIEHEELQRSAGAVAVLLRLFGSAAQGAQSWGLEPPRLERPPVGRQGRVSARVETDVRVRRRADLRLDPGDDATIAAWAATRRAKVRGQLVIEGGAIASVDPGEGVEHDLARSLPQSGLAAAAAAQAALTSFAPPSRFTVPGGQPSSLKVG